MPNDQFVNEASSSGCKKHLELLRTSTSNHIVSSHGPRKLEIEQLEGRLKILEQEAEILKGALLESKTLITDIHLHFHTIQSQSCLFQRGESCTVKERRRAGLMQILYHDSNPSIVNKGLRTKALAQDST